MTKTELSNEELARYSRHLLLPEIDLEGQARLNSARATIIGAGGLGSPCAMYLASSGVGHITIVDDDSIELSNLQRQIAFYTKDINAPKAQTLKSRLEALNPALKIDAVLTKATASNLPELIKNRDVVIDASDNFDTRFAINKECRTQRTTLVSGAAIQLSGQASVFLNKHPDSPCYQCLFPEQSSQTQETCRDRGVFAPLVGIIGSIMAAETIKILTGAEPSLADKLFTFDSKTMKSRALNIYKDPSCPVCGAQ